MMKTPGRAARPRRPLLRWTVWAAAAALGVVLALVASSPLGALNGLARSDVYRLDEGIAYGPLARQRLDVYTPTAPAATPARGWPVAVFFYGGSWNTGERGDYRFVAAALAERGVLAIVADYRLYPEVRFPEFLRDAALALAWGLENGKRLGGDPRRTFVMGHSAGGYNAAMLALDPRWLAPTGHDAKRELAGWIYAEDACRMLGQEWFGHERCVRTRQKGPSQGEGCVAKRECFGERDIGVRPAQSATPFIPSSSTSSSRFASCRRTKAGVIQRWQSFANHVQETTLPAFTDVSSRTWATV
jgi:acetyl esterase/lipase